MESILLSMVAEWAAFDMRVFDVFFSICQTEVDGWIPDEKTMFNHFFDQLKLADELGYSTAWVAETHLSTEIQKSGPAPVVPEFQGEIGLNTDILQLAHKIFGMTSRIHVGSAIRNILCNGGPIAHAESIKTFLSLHGNKPSESRKLHLGFASGRFEFSNRPYGITPRNDVERAAWPVVKGKIFLEATEIFLRLLRGDVLSSAEVTPQVLRREDFRSEEHWQKVLQAAGKPMGAIPLQARWNFERLGVIPREGRMELLELIMGSHDERAQIFANTFLPVGVFNLSITPGDEIERTHERMKKYYKLGPSQWTRHKMPRTVLVFFDRNTADKALRNYWKAVEGTLDEGKVMKAISNALVGTPSEMIAQINSRFHPDDRLMLWFDFNNHDNESVKTNMNRFMKEVIPKVKVGQ